MKTQNAQRSCRTPRRRRRRGLFAAVAGWASLLGLAAAGTPAVAADGPAAEAGSAVLGLLEAVEMTLVHDPNIALVESRLAAARGAVLRERGAFDPFFTADLSRADSEIPTATGEVSESEAVLGSAAVSQLLRTGLLLEPGVALSQSMDDGTLDEATVFFTFRQPLLRDRGREVVAAAERAAERERDAREHDLEQRIAERLLAVATQYWICKAAAEDLEVLLATEASSRELLDTTRRLVEADLTPAADVVQLEADLVSREASRIAGEGTLFREQQTLGREIGLEPAAIAALPLPGDPFPEVDPATVPAAATSAVWIDLALVRRADLAAARERQAAAETFLAAAGNALLPRLDFVVTPAYSGLSTEPGADGFFAPLFDNVPGLSTTVGFTLAWPVRNRAAEGAQIEAQAAVDQSRIAVELLEREVGAEVPAALDAVWRAALQLAKVDEAVGLFSRALDNELKKLRAGSSTLIDVISQRERLTSIRRQQVSAHLALALALVELRFTTGTLTGPDAAVRTVRRADFTTLPAPG